MTNIWIEDQDRFVETYGALYEHSEWIAARAWEKLDSDFSANPGKACVVEPDILLDTMAAVVREAGEEPQLALIRAHPDLAGRAAVTGELTSHSTDEQSSARLDQCSEVEYENFQRFNRDYKDKFGFPFIMAVRNRTRCEILEAFASRIDNSREQEFNLALDNIHQIARLRLEASLACT